MDDPSLRPREKDEVGNTTNRPDQPLDESNVTEDYGPNEKTLKTIADIAEPRGPA